MTIIKSFVNTTPNADCYRKGGGGGGVPLADFEHIFYLLWHFKPWSFEARFMMSMEALERNITHINKGDLTPARGNTIGTFQDFQRNLF